MFLAHSFRLRDPWKCEATETGATRWSRLFHRPTGLEPDDELLLVISGLPPEAEVTINGRSLAQEMNSSGPLPLEGRAGEGGEAGTRSNHPSLTLPIKGREPEVSDHPVPKDSQPLPTPHQYNITPLLIDANQIEILIPPLPIPHSPFPTPHSPLPTPTSFPYDARLAIIAHS